MIISIFLKNDKVLTFEYHHLVSLYFLFLGIKFYYYKFFFVSSACAAANLAIGTLYGEQDT